MEILEYVDDSDRSPFGIWYATLDAHAASRTTKALVQLSHGNTSNVKGVGSGVLELKVDFGPGYRVYFGKDGERIVILLAGGTKKRQQHDIEMAQLRWATYKARKKGSK
ncbi:MAG: addiction module protein [Alphaproteobacteria bacterium HGW-Alphaproteobacteria-3]|jgi:putative addiction module killer protein|nr:MAG: addiction module protein [Alphaproteobacteria bacterium HGW-Alphaproteobacteria-3]